MILQRCLAFGILERIQHAKRLKMGRHHQAFGARFMGSLNDNGVIRNGSNIAFKQRRFFRGPVLEVLSREQLQELVSGV